MQNAEKERGLVLLCNASSSFFYFSSFSTFFIVDKTERIWSDNLIKQ